MRRMRMLARGSRALVVVALVIAATASSASAASSEWSGSIHLSYSLTADLPDPDYPINGQFEGSVVIAGSDFTAPPPGATFPPPNWFLFKSGSGTYSERRGDATKDAQAVPTDPEQHPANNYDEFFRDDDGTYIYTGMNVSMNGTEYDGYGNYYPIEEAEMRLPDATLNGQGFCGNPDFCGNEVLLQLPPSGALGPEQLADGSLRWRGTQSKSGSGSAPIVFGSTTQTAVWTYDLTLSPDAGSEAECKRAEKTLERATRALKKAEKELERADGKRAVKKAKKAVKSAKADVKDAKKAVKDAC